VESSAIQVRGIETRLFEVSGALMAAKELCEKMREAVKWEQSAREAIETQENERLRKKLDAAFVREEALLERCLDGDKSVAWRKNEQRDLALLHVKFRESVRDASEIQKKLEKDMYDLEEARHAERIAMQAEMDAVQSALLSRDHDLNALRKRFSWLQEEHRHVVLEAEHLQKHLENDKAALQSAVRERDVLIDVQHQDHLAREAEQQEERQVWEQRLMTQARVEQLQLALDNQAAQLAHKKEEVERLKAAAARAYDVQQQMQLAGEAEFTATRDRWQARLAQQDASTQENTVLRKEIARLASIGTHFTCFTSTKIQIRTPVQA
jgi:regulator of replication initiation timing